MNALPNKLFAIVMFVVFSLSFISCDSDKDKYKIGRDDVVTNVQGEEKAILTSPPNVPPPITRNYPTKVIVELEVVEKEMEIMDGVTYDFWTYGGTVPGSFIRVREGDFVEFHLKNHPDSKVPHNIDLHAVTGQGGGAEATFTAPGYETVFNFTAMNPGLYVYHCATAPVGMHIANGMYGLILVEPKGGYPKVDKEYYVMQGDFYTSGKYGESGRQNFEMEKALAENPDYVLFNGRVGALTGDGAITATAGETVRLYVGNGGPNLVSSFHVIGEVFDNVYVEGGDLKNTNVQTTLVPAGGSAIVEFKVEVPGNFILVDHSIFRTFNKGALGILAVGGSENHKIYSGKEEAKVYQPEGSVIQSMPRGDVAEKKPMTFDEKMKIGATVYNSNCMACHQNDGAGIKGAFPPVAKSDYFADDVSKLIDAIVNGLQGPITVNGEKYNNIMPAQALSDDQAAAVATYVLNKFGNKGGEVSIDDIKAVRK